MAHGSISSLGWLRSEDCWHCSWQRVSLNVFVYCLLVIPSDVIKILRSGTLPEVIPTMQLGEASKVLEEWSFAVSGEVVCLECSTAWPKVKTDWPETRIVHCIFISMGCTGRNPVAAAEEGRQFFHEQGCKRWKKFMTALYSYDVKLRTVDGTVCMTCKDCFLLSMFVLQSCRAISNMEIGGGIEGDREIFGIAWCSGESTQCEAFQ